uniref:(California timema) hypothetical protein n=1 Tax=Timema californicum TaxID=61474 RepID=A0A7R9PC48_TIMCA|nr:unnamed protein product [Timema californicum]
MLSECGWPMSDYPISHWKLERWYSHVVIAATPGRVQNLTSWLVELGSVGLKWDPPFPGEDCVDHYIVEAQGNEYIVNATGDKLQYILSNLTLCKHQVLSLLSANSQGVLSKPASIHTTSGAWAPGEVNEPEVTQTGSHSLHLEWKRPLELFDCLVMYSVCWKETNKTDSACAEQKLKPYPKRTLYGLKSCTEYTVTLAALGVGRLHDNDATLTQSTGPEPVTALKVDNVDTRSVTVSWESPSCAQQFSVCWGAWQDKGGHSCTSVTNTSYTVSGLEPGYNYTIMVAALGVNEAQSDVRVVTASVAQEKVNKLTVKNYTRNSITVFWGAPFNQKSSQNASVCWNVIGEYSDEICSNSTISDEEYTIDDLEPCHWYKVTVALENGQGKKFESVEQFTAASNTEPPEEVKELSTRRIYYDSFRIEWDKSNDSCASHFLVCWEQSGNHENGCELEPSYKTSFNKDDLNVCTNVTVSVSAVSVDGLSSGNESITITTGPGVVRNVTSWIVELGSVGVRWEPPSPGEDCVSYYAVSTWGSHYPQYPQTQANVTGDKLEYVWTNLTHCEHKMFMIRAVNSQHAVSNSALKFSTSGTGAPGEVTEPEVTQTGSHSLHVEWKPPLELFDCLLRYSVCWKETNGTDGACAEQKLEEYPKRTLYGLKSCTEYTVTLASLGAGRMHDNDTTLTQFTVTVSWESPSCAQQFSVCWGAWQDKGGHSCTSVTNTRYTVSGLEPGNNYTIMVAALGVNEAQSDINIITVQLPPGMMS